MGTLCLMNLSLNPDAKFGGHDTVWTLTAQSILTYSPIYLMSDIEKSRYYSVLVGNTADNREGHSHGPESALLYLYNNEEKGKETIAFVRWRGQGYHFTADMQTPDQYSYLGDRGGYYFEIGSQCISTSYAWPWSPSSKTIDPYTYVDYYY
ncbi:hypothetical protein V1506DRAFT_386842 [Lipomyces tetrasporus]